MKKRSLTLFVLSLTMLVSGGLGQANTIGQWEGSGVDSLGRLATWNFIDPGPSYSTTMIKALVTAAGHTVGPDAAITAANMAQYDSFVMRIPIVTPTAAEMAILSDWVEEGGLLFMLADYNYDPTPFNNILAGVGSEMRAEGSAIQNCWLLGGTFMTDGLANAFMGNTPGKKISGGTAR